MNDAAEAESGYFPNSNDADNLSGANVPHIPHPPEDGDFLPLEPGFSLPSDMDPSLVLTPISDIPSLPMAYETEIYLGENTTTPKRQGNAALARRAFDLQPPEIREIGFPDWLREMAEHQHKPISNIAHALDTYPLNVSTAMWELGIKPAGNFVPMTPAIANEVRKVAESEGQPDTDFSGMSNSDAIRYLLTHPTDHRYGIKELARLAGVKKQRVSTIKHEFDGERLLPETATSTVHDLEITPEIVAATRRELMPALLSAKNADARKRIILAHFGFTAGGYKSLENMWKVLTEKGFPDSMIQINQVEAAVRRVCPDLGEEDEYRQWLEAAYTKYKSSYGLAETLGVKQQYVSNELRKYDITRRARGWPHYTKAERNAHSH